MNKTGMAAVCGLALSLSLGACKEMPTKPAATPPANSPNVQVPSASEAGAGNAQDNRYISALAALQQKDPVQDAQAAIARGQRYFLCNAGRSSTVPGLSAEVYASVRDRCPTECLDGVTDALYGSNHARYLGAALDYSARWNQTMLPACR